MTENVEKFLEALEADAEFAEKIAQAETVEEALALAQEKGFTLTEEDLQPAAADGELDDAELEDVAGGTSLIMQSGPLAHLLYRFGSRSSMMASSLVQRGKNTAQAKSLVFRSDTVVQKSNLTYKTADQNKYQLFKL